jgi:hypothetical protein
MWPQVARICQDVRRGEKLCKQRTDSRHAAYASERLTAKSVE